MSSRQGRIAISRPSAATANPDTLTTVGFGLRLGDPVNKHSEDRPSDSIRRTSQEELSPKGWKVALLRGRPRCPNAICSNRKSASSGSEASGSPPSFDGTSSTSSTTSTSGPSGEGREEDESDRHNGAAI